MSWKRTWAMFKARNYEFFRDKAAFGWNFLFPFLIIAGFGLIFGDRDLSGFKVGVFPVARQSVSLADSGLPKKFVESPHLAFIGSRPTFFFSLSITPRFLAMPPVMANSGSTPTRFRRE